MQCRANLAAFSQPINGDDGGDYIITNSCRLKVPMVELMTINKALPGDNPTFKRKTFS